MKNPADIFLSMKITQDIINRHNFDPVAVIKDVPASKYPDAIKHLHGPRCQKRWDAKKDRIAEVYRFEFEDLEDAFLFRMCI